jgi:hypothetical protein
VYYARDIPDWNNWKPWLTLLQRLPYLSAGIVMILGLVMTAFGLQATWLVTQRKPN